MERKAALQHTLKVWLTVVIPVIVVFSFLIPIRPLSKRIFVLTLYALIFSAPGGLAYFTLMRFSDRLNPFTHKLGAYALVAGTASFYATVTGMFLYNVFIFDSNPNLIDYFVNIHTNGSILILPLTIASCFFWALRYDNRKE